LYCIIYTKLKLGAKETIYKNLPVALQNLAVSCYGRSWYKRRYGGIFSEQLALFKDREFYSKTDWENYVNEQLRKMTFHAIENVSFYKEKFKECGISENSLANISVHTIGLLPMLEKDELRQFGETKLLAYKREKKGVFFASSGSTGTPSKIFLSHAMHQRWSAAFESRIRHWAGVDMNTPRGMIGGRRVLPEGEAKPPFFRYNFVEKQVYFSAYHIAASTANNYLKAFYKHHIQYMHGYAMSNYFLARFFDELKLQPPPLKAIITSSEKLTQEMRDTFLKVYQCKSFDSWSGVEANALISECEHGSLHVSPDVGWIEIIDEDGKPCPPGKAGEVVCTGFLNYDQPLIRYRIGDIMKWSDKSCRCGRSMPVIEEIVGRLEDVVIGSDGREMVRFHGLFVGLKSVFEGQVIQHTLTDLEIKVVAVNGLLKTDEELIRKRLESQLGHVDLILSVVDHITRTSNGKFKAVISHVKRNNLS